MKERAHIPRVGISLDRRALQNVGEVLNPQRVSVLMCFICGCKHIHYDGFDMFGNSRVKGKIRWRDDPRWLKKLFTEKKMTNRMSPFLLIHLRGYIGRQFPAIPFCKMIHSNGFAAFVELDVRYSVAPRMCSGPLNVSILEMKFVYDAKFLYARNAVFTLTKTSNHLKLLRMTTTSHTRMLSLCKSELPGWKRRSHVPSSQVS